MKAADKIWTYDYAALLDLKQGTFGSMVLTAGCFDALHIGHIEHLEFCKEQGEFLVVCIGNDTTVRMLKGVGRPVIHGQARARMVAALECVDAVVESEESGRMNFTRLMELLKPTVLVVAEDDPSRKMKMALCARFGVDMVIDGTRPEAGPSTTGIVSQILEGVR